MNYVGSCQITTPNCVPSLGRVRQGRSQVGTSEDNGLECGVGGARGGGVNCGWECALGRTEEAEVEKEEGEGVRKGLEVSQENQEPHR